LVVVFHSSDSQYWSSYLTGTNVKLILVADSFNAKEAVVKKVFRDLHSAYIDAVSNPFYNPGKVNGELRELKSMIMMFLSIPN